MEASIPDNVLEAAEKVLLRDLLDSPTFRPWVVSSLSNGLNNPADILANDDDQFLQFKLSQMIRAIPYETRKECFNETGRMIRERREAKQS